MKKWKKIQKSLIRKWRQTQCDWFGHQPVTVIEERWRGKQNILNRKGGKPRKGWITTCFVVKQIDSDIPAEVVPKMQSLPQHAKNLLNAFGVGSISYRSQCLLVEQAGDGNGATNYVPDWVDMFAKDWFVLGGE